MEHNEKDILIKVEKITMNYRMPTQKVDSLKEFVIRFLTCLITYR